MTSTEEEQGSELTEPAERTARRGSGGSGDGPVALGIFLVCLVVYLLSPVKTVTDSVWTVYVANSIIEEGNVDLDEYQAAVDEENGWQTVQHDGHTHYKVAIGAPVLSVPFVLLGKASDGLFGTELMSRLPDGGAQTIDPMIASLFAAATVAVVFALARESGLGRRPSLLVAAVFALASPAWSTASRSLWMHGPSMLMVGLTLYFFLLARRDPRWLAACGAAAMTAFFVRPTNTVTVGVFALLALYIYRRRAWRFLAGAGGVFAFFVVLDLVFYGQPLPLYMRTNHIRPNENVPEALAGNLISPARGLLVFCPFLLLAIWGAWLKWKDDEWRPVDTAVAAVVVAHWVGVSFVPLWYAGWSYGPRYMTDVLPLLFWFFLPAAGRLASWQRQRQPLTAGQRAVRGFAVAGIAFAFVVHMGGAVRDEGFIWNQDPISVDLDPSRVWDWSDPQFLRPFR